MKKVFCQFGLFALGRYFIYLAGIVLIVLTCVAVLGNLIDELYTVLAKLGAIIILLYPLSLGVYSFVCDAHNKAIFHNHQIMITGQLGKEAGGIYTTAIYQYKDKIDMRDIRDVKLVFANTDSRKKVKRYAGKGSLRPMLYFEFILADGTTKWMWITPYSRGQRRKMLAIVNDKTGLNLSYDLLEEYDYSMFARKKKQVANSGSKQATGQDQ